MKPMQRLTCLLALCFAASASAKVTMEIPDTIDLLVVNGSSPKLSGGFFDATKKLELEDGEQQIVFRYSPYFSQGNDRIIIDSEVVIATLTLPTKNSVLICLSIEMLLRRPKPSKPCSGNYLINKVKL